MVQGINWNNYSANQIVELKNQGVEVPEKVYKNAQAQISETDAQEVKAESKDDAKVSYNIENTADQKNEAKELRAQMEQEGADLEEIVEKFTEKSNAATQDITAAMQEIQGFVSYISENQTIAEALGSVANDEAAVVMQVVADAENEIQQKQDELDFLNEKIEDGTATESEQNKAEHLGADINKTAGKAQAAISEKTSVAANLNTQMVAVNDNLKEVANKTGKALNDAKDAIEVANETKDVSKELYDKGAKKQKLAMAIASIVGGVGGFFAGKAVSNKLNNDMYANRYNQGKLSSPAEMADANKTAKTTRLIGKGGGALAGAGLGLAIGSMFGASEMKKGQAGIDAASTLNEVSTKTKAVAEKIAEQNNITISEVSVSDAQVADFDAEVSEGDKSMSDNAEKAVVAEAPETVDKSIEEDEDTKKKQPVA